MNKREWGRKGNVYLRGKTYWIRYPDGTGKYRFESAETADEQEAWVQLSDRLYEIKHDQLPAKTKERRRTVNSLFDALAADYAVRKLRSLHNMTTSVKKVREAIGERRASNITKADLDRFVLDQREAGYAEATIVHQLKLLKQAFLLQKAIKPPDFPKGLKGAIRDKLIHPAEQRQLCAALAKDYHRDLAEMYFATGWRGVELRTLRWEHVREDTIHLVEENSKTRSPRDFPLTGEAAEIIERRRAKRVPACPFVFHRGGHPLGYRTWLIAWQRAAIKVGLATYDPNRPDHHRYEGPNPHDNRRAFVTTTLNSGVDPQVARTLSGHKSNAIFDRYRILETETLKQAIEQREQYIRDRARNVRFLADRIAQQKLDKKLDNPAPEARKANGDA